MTDTKHTRGPWGYDGPSSGTKINDDGGDFAIYVKRDGKSHIIAETYRQTDAANFEPAEANAHLIVRLANLYFAGTARAEKRTSDVFARGDIPVDPDYGLTENEVAACRMLNALMDENTELLEALECLIDEVDQRFDEQLEQISPNGDTILTAPQSAIAKAKGDTTPAETTESSLNGVGLSVDDFRPGESA